MMVKKLHVYSKIVLEFDLLLLVYVIYILDEDLKENAIHLNRLYIDKHTDLLVWNKI